MQYTPERAVQIIEEIKTQTRRPVHDRDIAMVAHLPDTDQGYKGCDAVYSANGAALRYLVGHTYAVQPGRGKPTSLYMPGAISATGKNEIATPAAISTMTTEVAALLLPARIRLLEIWREDVRKISLDDAHAEGFKTCGEFYQAWIMMYDPILRRQLVRTGSVTGLMDRPAALYMAWALKFELVK